MKFAVTAAGWLLLPFLVTTEPVLRRWNVGATVHTTSGPITGHAAKNRTQVSEYLGIPYAQPPLGQLRFAAPQQFTSTKPFDAAAFSPDCPANPAKPFAYPNATAAELRIVANFAGQAGNAQSEDCLTLNVWTKKPTTKKQKAVLLWFYGGRFNIGGSNTPFYQGQYLADEQDVVVVTINYRVNIFGFSGAPSETQNVGLLDQRLAVEWVRDNINGFGGDPTKITLFGQSAGGASVDYYSYIWTEDPIIHGLISQSGTALSFTPNSQAMSTKSFYNASAILGCGASGDVLPCMRTKNTTEILKAISLITPAPSKALPAPIFQPTVDNKTVFADYNSLAASGNFIKVPYLAGNNDFEYGYYQISVVASNKTLSAAQVNLFNLEAFVCPTDKEAMYRINNGVPTWRYRYFGEFPNLRLYPGSGAYHGSEIEQVFGTAVDVSLEPNTKAEDAISKYMMNAWAKFANDPTNGLNNLGWPEYNPQCDTLIRLGYNNQTTASFVSPQVYDAQCAALGGVTSDSTGAF